MNATTVDYIVQGAMCRGDDVVDKADPTRVYRVKSTIRAVVFNFDSAELVQTIEPSLFEKQHAKLYPDDSPYPRDDISTFLANCLKFVRSCPVQNEDASVRDFFTDLFTNNNSGSLLFSDFIKKDEIAPDLTFGDVRDDSTPRCDDKLPYTSHVSLPTWYYAQLAGIRNMLHRDVAVV